MKNNNLRLAIISSASAVVTLAAAISTDVMEFDNTDPGSNTNPDVGETISGTIIDEDDDDGHFYTPHEGNSTLSATFSIRVTPEHYHMFYWTILWLCFASAVTFGLHQERLERRWLKSVIAASVSSNTGSSQSHLSSSSRRRQPGGSDPELGGKGGKNYTRSVGGRYVRSSGRFGGSKDRMTLSSSTASISSGSHPVNLGDEQVVSSGDLARGMVSQHRRRTLSRGMGAL